MPPPPTFLSILSERLSSIIYWFHPTYDALTAPHLPWSYRWRLLVLQPIAILTYSIPFLPHLFSRRFHTIRIPTRTGATLRAAVFPPPASRSIKGLQQLHPLHLNVHGGAFLGGLPESNAVFCAQLAARTGAVVVSATYRAAPRHVFPAAHDDVDDVVRWLRENAEEALGADPSLFTVSGFSAGGNLALSAAMSNAEGGEGMEVKAAVVFCASGGMPDSSYKESLIARQVDLRLPPEAKPKPPGFPKIDPLRFLFPLFDSYAAPVRSRNVDNIRLNPVLAPVGALPRSLLFVVAGMDILLDENLRMVERLKQEAARDGGRKVESMVFEEQMHGWLELPSIFIEEKTRTKAFDAAIDIVQHEHREGGWEWRPHQ